VRLDIRYVGEQHRGWGYTSLKLNLTIDGMHCGSCVRRVTLALQKVEGVETETVQVEVGSASLDYDLEKSEPQEIIDAVNKIGFTAHAV
jgi:copper chaperone